MTAPDLAEIVRLARAATPGPWMEAVYSISGKARSRIGPAIIADTGEPIALVGVLHPSANAAYIAALSPAVVLAWAEHTERLREVLKETIRVAKLAPSIGCSGLCTGVEKAIHDAELALAGRSEGETK